jgi:cyclophilin family peptidyl-prolyl cis-trans isomerase
MSSILFRLFTICLIATLCWRIANAGAERVLARFAETCQTGQESESSTDDTGFEGAKGEFDRTLAAWRNEMGKIQEAGMQFFHAETLGDSHRWKEEYQQRLAAGVEKFNRFLPAAIKLIEQAPSLDLEMAELAIRIQRRLFESGRLDKSFEIGEKILAQYPEKDPAIEYTKRAALLSNRFAEFSKYRAFTEQEVKGLTDQEKKLLQIAQPLADGFARESKLRKDEELADDLPRVEFVTTKGPFVIELFENQAPQTVANFVSLVESQFYDDLLFHPVVNSVVAQTGYLNNDGKTKTVDYQIYDEHHREDARWHFRGSVGMVQSPNMTNSAGAQFYIGRAPLIGLNGNSTVFGRVISGMDNVDRLANTVKITKEKQEPIPNVQFDSIISTRVVRKRPHPYEPRKVEKENEKQ